MRKVYDVDFWIGLIEELEPCRDCVSRGRMWITKCQDRCCAMKRWVGIRKIARDRCGV